MSPTFHSLRVRNFRLFVAGSAISFTGSWMQRVAQDWLVLQLTDGSGAALGITTGLQFLPLLLLAPMGGVLVDRFPRRRILFATNVAMGALAVVLGVLVLTGGVQVWHVYVFAFLLGAFGAVEQPARQSFTGELVSREDLPNAVSLLAVTFHGARVIGPASAGLLIEAFDGSTGGVFVLNGISFVASLAALAAIDATQLRARPLVARAKGQVREGMRYLRGRRDLLLLFGVVCVLGTFGLNFQLTTALMATEVFGKGAGGYGLLPSIMAIGAVGGALVAARRSRPSLRLVLGGTLAFGLLEVAAGLMPTYGSFAVTLIPIGFATLTVLTAANATVQLAVEPAYTGRVMALYLAVFMGGTPIGAPIIGWVGDAFGARWTLVGGGLVTAVAALVALAAVARRRRVSRLGDAPVAQRQRQPA